MKTARKSCLLLCVALAACSAKPQSTPHTNPSQPASGSTGGGSSGNAAPTDPEPTPVGVAPACTPDLPADVTVRVKAKQGPLGGTPLAFDNNLYDMNIDDQVRGDYVPGLNDQFVAYLKALRPALLRWPAGYYGQQYQWQTSGDGQYIMTPALVDAFVNLARAVGAQPFLAININTGTPANAVNFVSYVNVEKQYGVQWWQIGNEPDVDGLNATHNPQNYVNTFNTFAQTLRGIDPSIKLVGGEVMTGEDILGQAGNSDWMTPIVQNAGAQMDALAWHYYPMDSSQTNPNSTATPSVAHLLQEDAQDWPPAGLDFASQVMPALTKLRDQYAPRAELWIDEFAEDSGMANGVGISDHLVGALWAADALGRYAEQGANAVFKFIFKGEGQHGYTLLDSDNNPRPEYYTYWLYAQHFGDRMVKTDNDHIDQVAVHAAMRGADGSLRVVLVNKQPGPKVVHLSLSDFAPTSAASYQLVGDSYDATAVTLNGETLTPTNIDQGQRAIAPQAAADCADNAMTLPPYSVTLLVYKP